MTRWERLTPEDNHPERDIHYYQCHPLGEHGIGTSVPGYKQPNRWVDKVWLNDAELLALARKLNPAQRMELAREIPEVQALAEAAQGVVDGARVEIYQPGCTCGACVRRANLAAALAKVEA